MNESRKPEQMINPMEFFPPPLTFRVAFLGDRLEGRFDENLHVRIQIEGKVLQAPDFVHDFGVRLRDETRTPISVRTLGAELADGQAEGEGLLQRITDVV